MRSIKHIQDVVDWGLCVGCGACYSVCSKGSVFLENIEPVGIRPRFNQDTCSGCTDCLFCCPGYCIDARREWENLDDGVNNLLIGPTLKVWEGYASDEEIRYRASSGGLLTAISLYCLEKENMAFVLHTGMNDEKPWTNITAQSRNRNELLSRSGSRYAASSPCDSLKLIEESERPCVFIGKPCDAAAVSALRKQRQRLDKNLGLVLTFCCAGTPSSRASLDLLKKFDVNPEKVRNLHYRGNGWPGGFTVFSKNGKKEKFLPYMESWHFLQKYRPFRCKLCPDGLGELGDISFGDAWHRHAEGKEDPGLSLVMVRSLVGKDILRRAVDAGYVKLTPSSPQNVIKAQGLVERRKAIFGRQLAMKLLLIPTTRFIGFKLFPCWLKAPLIVKLKSIIGTLRRLLQRGLWHRNPL